MKFWGVLPYQLRCLDPTSNALLKIRTLLKIYALYSDIYIYIYLARIPEIGQGLGRILSCGARKPEQT